MKKVIGILAALAAATVAAIGIGRKVKERKRFHRL